MDYIKQTWVDGVTPLDAARMNHIEDGIKDNSDAVALLTKRVDSLTGGGSSIIIGTVELSADKWVGDNNLYSQVVTIDGVTARSQVDLTPSVEQLVVFYEKDLTFVTENEGGIVTVYAIGQKPANDYTIQVTITEVGV